MLFLRAVLSLFQSSPAAARRAELLPRPRTGRWKDYAVGLVFACVIVAGAYWWVYYDVTRPTALYHEQIQNKPRASQMEEPDSAPVEVTLTASDDANAASTDPLALTKIENLESKPSVDLPVSQVRIARPDPLVLKPQVEIKITPPTAFLTPENSPAAPVTSPAVPAP